MKVTKRNKEIQEVDYTKTSFNEIREELNRYVKRHYPDTYKDFKQSSFGSMMLDLVSYVGDQLHYYLDHNANEAIPALTKDPEVLISHIVSMGHTDPVINPTSVGNIEVQILRPADSLGIGLDNRYELDLLAGSTYQSIAGTVFTQTTDITINAQNSQIMGYNTTPDGSKIDYFNLKVTIPVISGQEKTFEVDIGDFQRFLKIEIPDPSLTEILKVVNSDGEEWFEIDHLTTEDVITPIIEPRNLDKNISSVMKIKSVPRRFIVVKTLNKTYLQFGSGSDKTELTTSAFSDSRKKAINLTGKKHTPVSKMDISNHLATNKLGVAPSNTTLTITYRANTSANSNAAVGTVNQVLDPVIFFKNEQLLDIEKVAFIKENVQVYNDEPINGNITIPNTEELKRRYLGTYGSQGRAVTSQDYVTAAYSMPTVFGSIKRAAITIDDNDLRRNLNMHLVAEGADGKLQIPSAVLKENVKTYLNSVRMISDSIDLFDARIINLGIEFRVQLNKDANQQTTLAAIKNRIFEELTTIPPEIGESFYISEVIRIIQNIPEVRNMPIKDGVRVTSKVGTDYSDYSYDIKNNTSPDNSYIFLPQNSIWEIKYIDDIKGTVIL